jgi:hypothetical protein
LPSQQGNVMPLTWEQFRIKGASNDRRFAAGDIAGDSKTTGTIAPNTLVAIPFLVPVAQIFDIITVNITTVGAGSSARVGIYKDNGSLYPGSLYFGSGSIDTSTGNSGSYSLLGRVMKYFSQYFLFMRNCFVSKSKDSIKSLCEN